MLFQKWLWQNYFRHDKKLQKRKSSTKRTIVFEFIPIQDLFSILIEFLRENNFCKISSMCNISSFESINLHFVILILYFWFYQYRTMNDHILTRSKLLRSFLFFATLARNVPWVLQKGAFWYFWHKEVRRPIILWWKFNGLGISSTSSSSWTTTSSSTSGSL